MTILTHICVGATTGTMAVAFAGLMVASTAGATMRTAKATAIVTVVARTQMCVMIVILYSRAGPAHAPNTDLTFDQLDRESVGPLDHRGPGCSVTEIVYVLQHLDTHLSETVERVRDVRI